MQDHDLSEQKFPYFMKCNPEPFTSMRSGTRVRQQQSRESRYHLGSPVNCSFSQSFFVNSSVGALVKV